MDVEPAEVARLARLLSPPERARAAHFRFTRDRRRFVVRRGRLRELLAGRLGCAPGDVALTCNAYGKPRLGRGELRFNLSQSGEIALYALAEGREVGCDIEWRDDALPVEALAAQFFSPQEATGLRALPPDRRAEGFFNCWTRKEAFVKARGLGLSFPLDAFEVSLAPDEPAVMRCGGDGWSLSAFEPLPRLHAAVVAEGRDWRMAAKSGNDTPVNRLREGLVTPGPTRHTETGFNSERR